MNEKINKIEKWISEYVKKSNARGVVIGNSGGKDSAVVIALCTKAIGQDNVVAVQMPCYSTKQDLEDGNLVANTFGIKNMIVNIEKTYESLKKTIEDEGQKLNSNSEINIKPRLRMTTLYAIAQTLGYLVVGTGNLCEIYIGYTTKWGDSASDFNPLANLTVKEILEIGESLGVPKRILEKAPNDGLGSGTDEEKLGITYKQIEEYIKTGKTDSQAMKKIEEMHNKTEHKRKPIPTYGG